MIEFIVSLGVSIIDVLLLVMELIDQVIEVIGV